MATLGRDNCETHNTMRFHTSQRWRLACWINTSTPLWSRVIEWVREWVEVEEWRDQVVSYSWASIIWRKHHVQHSAGGHRSGLTVFGSSVLIGRWTFTFLTTSLDESWIVVYYCNWLCSTKQFGLHVFFNCQPPDCRLKLSSGYKRVACWIHGSVNGTNLDHDLDKSTDNGYEWLVLNKPYFSTVSQTGPASKASRVCWQ